MARSRLSRRSRTGTAPVGALRRNYDVVCNYVEIEKTYRGKIPMTVCRLPKKGRVPSPCVQIAHCSSAADSDWISNSPGRRRPDPAAFTALPNRYY